MIRCTPHHRTSFSRWLPLLGLLGGVGCLDAAPPEQEVETSEALGAAAALCGGPHGLACPKTSYCMTPANTCPGPKQTGVCRPRPQICPNVFIPVCGCDGKTYPNACQAARAGASVAQQGACPRTATCTSNTECAAGDFCQERAGACGGTGTCAPKPELCPEIFKPVCGCDGKTYSNACFASAAGVNVASQGQCAPAQTCGGFLGTPCPGGGKCVDDPSDDCDPAHGGADCIGLCTCVENVLCIQGFHFDSSPQVCACVPDQPAT